jgi:hypothetical protein
MAKKREIYQKIHNRFNEDDYATIAEKDPDFIEWVEALLEKGESAEAIGRKIRAEHPHKWPQSKVIEGVAKYIKQQQNE